MQSIEWLMRLNNTGTRLSKSHQLIAQHIATHYEKAMFCTAEDISKQCHVSESTVTRFAKSMGYTGYPSFRKALRALATQHLTTQQRFAISAEMQEEQVLQAVLKNDIRNIKKTTELLTEATFQQAVLCLQKAKRIFIMGLRSAAPLAQFMHHYLYQISSDVWLLQNSISDMYEDLSHIGENDVLFAISFPRYSKLIPEGMRFAKSNGATTIALTDSVASPLSEVADICLCAATDMTGFVDSLAAPLSVINALVVRLGLTNKDALDAHFQKLEGIWNANDVYLTQNND